MERIHLLSSRSSFVGHTTIDVGNFSLPYYHRCGEFFVVIGSICDEN